MSGIILVFKVRNRQNSHFQEAFISGWVGRKEMSCANKFHKGKEREVSCVIKITPKRSDLK